MHDRFLVLTLHIVAVCKVVLQLVVHIEIADLAVYLNRLIEVLLKVEAVAQPDLRF